MEVEGKNYHFIAVAGNIGTGKSTLVKFLAEEFKLEPVFEPFEENPFLKDFYKDMKRWSFHSQIFFLTKKFALHKKYETKKNHIILDRPIYEDGEIFAKNLYKMKYLSDREYKTYRLLYSALVQTLRKPSLLIYLKCNLKTLYWRIRERGRKEESTIKYEYLRSLQNLYHDWIRRYSFSPVITIDTGRANYLDDFFRRQELIEKINDIINS